MNDHVKQRLDAVWAPWARQQVVYLGYPRETTIGRCMREGPSAGQASRSSPPDNLEAERIEIAIRALDDRRLIRAVKLRHIGQYPMRLRDIGLYMKRSPRTIRYYLTRAYAALERSL